MGWGGNFAYTQYILDFRSQCEKNMALHKALDLTVVLSTFPTLMMLRVTKWLFFLLSRNLRPDSQPPNYSPPYPLKLFLFTMAAAGVPCQLKKIICLLHMTSPISSSPHINTKTMQQETSLWNCFYTIKHKVILSQRDGHSNDLQLSKDIKLLMKENIFLSFHNRQILCGLRKGPFQYTIIGFTSLNCKVGNMF